MKTIKDLRETLFETIAALRDKEKPMDVDRANAVANLSREIIGSLKVEIDFRKQMGIKSGSTFLPDAQPPTAPPAPRPAQGADKSPNGYTGKLHPEASNT